MAAMISNGPTGWAAVAALALGAVPAFADTIEVPGNHATIQAAITAGSDGDVVLVAPGEYAEKINFLGKALTVQSSGGAEVTTINGQSLALGSLVTFSAGEGLDSVLEGFTIANGRTEQDFLFSGGGAGIIVSGASPTIRDCVLADNVAAVSDFGFEAAGGGMAIYNGSPRVENCQFLDNAAQPGNGFAMTSGGAVFVLSGSPVFIGCEFTGNSATGDGGAVNTINAALLVLDGCHFESNESGRGGAMYVTGGTATVVDSVFRVNEAASYAGAMVSSGASSRIERVRFESNHSNGDAGALGSDNEVNDVVASCVFIGNTASSRGGAMTSIASASPLVVNSTFYANSAPTGGAVYSHGDSSITIINSILWNNGSAVAGSASVTYSDVEGGFTGVGNIDEPPMFADPNKGDIHLTPQSPCANTAKDDLPVAVLADFEGQSREQQCRKDMGADESPFFFYDCNGNGVADACDIETGASDDLDGNGWPDECNSGGDIVGSVTWNGVVHVVNDVEIFGTLSIEPDTLMLVEPGVAISVQFSGSLIANGSEAAPIVFTPISEGRWDGILGLSGSTINLAHVIIERTVGQAIASESADVTLSQCEVRDVAGAAPGGSARGIVLSNGAAVIRGTAVHEIIASPGTSGGAGAAGPDGADGADGTFIFPSGDDGDPGTPGQSGVPGNAGGTAVGIDLAGDIDAVVESCIVHHLIGGAGGDGGSGGNGGGGGNGGYGVYGALAAWWGGDGGNGAAGGVGGSGADAGGAIGIRAAGTPGASIWQVLAYDLAGGSGGRGGAGGAGGAGGNGGGGGETVVPFDTGGDGGDGGNGAHGGAAGAGGDSGESTAIAIIDSTEMIESAHHTLADIAALAGGQAGQLGAGGAAGSGGAGGHSELGSDGDDGEDGSPGAPGAAAGPGAPGRASGVRASAQEISPPIVFANSIFALGEDGGGVGIRAEGEALIEVEFSCFWDLADPAEGDVIFGDGITGEDPAFIDPSMADFRLSAGSACIDAGNNEQVPAGLTLDIDGQARFVDDPDTPDTGSGSPPVVDMGAYEFQTAGIPADLNDDGVVNTIDLGILLASWTLPPATTCSGFACHADINHDGVVNTIDLGILLSSWTL